MNRSLTAGIALTTALVLASCGGGSDEPDTKPTSEKSTAATTQIPKPTDTQADALVHELDKIAPGLASEPEDTIDNARNVCDSILGGAQNLEESTKTRFTGDGVESLSIDQAKQIITAVKAAPWCK